MTLKELRLLKKLTQESCANIAGVSLRTYKSYENNKELANTLRYNAIYNSIEGYHVLKESPYIDQYSYFFTNVKTGIDLNALIIGTSKYKKRDCFQYLKNYMDGAYDGRVCILYGLRRTGKTTLLFQMIRELPQDKTAYIKIQTTDTMAALTKDLNKLYSLGYRYIFIDEVTLMEDFINTSAVLADIFSTLGMKIVLSGTDSLCFALADKDELYDRNVMIHTSFIPFREYARLLDINSIDSYIEYGGTLKKENMSFDDRDFHYDEVSFRDDESTRKYIDTAISRNIQNALKNNQFGSYFNMLQELYDKGELTNAINRIVENMNHYFLLSVIENEFKSHDYGSAKNILVHEAPSPCAYVLSSVDEKEIIKRLKNIIDVKEKKELTVPITQEHIETLKHYLLKLDLIFNCPYQVESHGQVDYYIFTQPGMRYAIAKALVYSLVQDPYFNNISEKDKSYIIDKILNDVKGRMLEDIVLLETVKSLHGNKKAFKFRFNMGGEFDMVIYDNDAGSCEIYEVKHSDKLSEKQTQHLKDLEKCSLIERRYGTIKRKCVLYRGTGCIEDNIEYVNVEEYLKNL